VGDYCASATAFNQHCIIVSTSEVTVSIPTILDKGLTLSDSSTLIVNSNLTVGSDLVIGSDATIQVSGSTIQVTNCLKAEGTLLFEPGLIENSPDGEAVILVRYDCLGSTRFNVPQLSEMGKCGNLEYTSSSLQMIVNPCTKNSSQEKAMESWTIGVIIGASVLAIVVIMVVMIKFRDRIFTFRNRDHYSVEANDSQEEMN
jgi:hypothetical protein